MDGVVSDDVSEAVTWLDCVHSTLSILSEESHEMYNERYKTGMSEMKNVITSMVRNITQRLSDVISASTEYSYETQQEMLNKLVNIQTSFSPMDAIELQISLSTSSDILFLYRAQMANSVRKYRDYAKIGQVVQFPKAVKWYKLSPEFDPYINVLGRTCFCFLINMDIFSRPFMHY